MVTHRLQYWKQRNGYLLWILMVKNKNNRVDKRKIWFSIDWNQVFENSSLFIINMTSSKWMTSWKLFFADVSKYRKIIYQMKALSKTNRLVPISLHFSWKPENYYSFCYFLWNHSPNKVLLLSRDCTYDNETFKIR